MEKKKLRELLIASVCVVGVYFLFDHAGEVLGFLQTILGILLPFVLGGACAFVLNVPMRFLENRVLCVLDKKAFLKKIKRPLALVLVLALVIAVVYLLMRLIVPEILSTLESIVRAIPAFIARLDELLAPYDISISQTLSASLTVPSPENLNAQLSDMLDLVIRGAMFSTSVIGSVYQNMLSVFFTIMFTIYFLFSKERLHLQLRKVADAYLKPEQVKEVWRVSHLTQHTFSSFITGQCLEALILGGLFFVTMWLFRMPYVLLISLFIAVMALVPVIGAWLGCIVGALLILMNDPMQAIGFVAMFLVLQQIEGNLIYPHVMGSAIGLPSLWVLFAVLLGDGLMGILGMLLFIPLTSVGYTLFREHVNHRLEMRKLQADGKG